MWPYLIVPRNLTELRIAGRPEIRRGQNKKKNTAK